jgi:diguanylate cyclase (GGDEF)-like protein
MLERLKIARAYLAPGADPYAGADLANVQRLGSLLWGLVALLIVLIWIPSPPTEAIGRAGWLPAIAIATAAFGLVAAMRHGRWLNSWDRMLAVSYGAVFAIAGLVWLSGGLGSPDERLYLLPILFVATLHPPRRIAVFLSVVALALAAPFVYDGFRTQEAGAVFVAFVTWSMLAVLAGVLMAGVRAQRVALAREQAEARQEARIDKLTGLHNRRGFDEALELEVARARRLNLALSVAMIDLRALKEINDGWGHSEGDRCLRDAAAAINSAVRQPDLCFRWGGDEFALVLPGTAAGDVGPLGVRLANVVDRECRRPDREPMEISFAVAEMGPGMSAAELADLAGLALSAAKSQAREGAADPVDDTFG